MHQSSSRPAGGCSAGIRQREPPAWRPAQHRRQVSTRSWRASRFSPAGGEKSRSADCCLADPMRCCYRRSWRPALAEITGDGRPWTGLMISLLSMPWRYMLVMPRLACWICG